MVVVEVFIAKGLLVLSPAVNSQALFSQLVLKLLAHPPPQKKKKPAIFQK